MAKKGKVEIDRDLCKGCLLCVRACPVKVLEADTEFNASGCYPAKAVLLDKCEPAPSLTATSGQAKVPLCIGCGNCYEVCPDVCIRVYELGEQSA